MELVQYIYTSVVGAELSAQGAYDISLRSALGCKKFGISGRVFANRQKALAIMEGPEDVVAHYFESVKQDTVARKILLHVQRPIETREFSDFSVWLNAGKSFRSTEHVCQLTEASLHLAWPKTLSAKVRIMAEAYLDPDMLAAS